MWLNRILGALGRSLITVGTILLLFAGFQLWGTGIEEAGHQADLAHHALRQLKLPADDDPGDEATVERITAALARLDPATAPATAQPEDGSWVGMIEIPRIGLSARSIIAGVSKADLRKGPGHYPDTPLPGQPGNAAIAGHRTTYGAPFNRIDELTPGDDIIVYTAQGRFRYVVEAPPDGAGIERGAGWFSVRPDATWVVGDSGGNTLTLTACHPKYSARQRIVVRARLTAEPAAAAPTTARPAVPDGRSRVVDTAASDLDGGFGGDRSALAPAIGFLVAFFAVWALAWWWGRHWRPWATHLVLLGPAAAMLWLCFVFADRYLPSI